MKILKIKKSDGSQEHRKVSDLIYKLSKRLSDDAAEISKLMQQAGKIKDLHEAEDLMDKLEEEALLNQIITMKKTIEKVKQIFAAAG